jgi:hypothetical protein
MGYDNTYHIGQKGLVGAQTNPTLAIDSGNNAVIAWEDDRFAQSHQTKVSFDYRPSPTTAAFGNYAVLGVGNGGGATNSTVQSSQCWGFQR